MNQKKMMAAWLLVAMLLSTFGAWATEIKILQPNMRRISSNIATTLDYLPDAARAREDEVIIGVPDLFGDINPFFAWTTGDQYTASLMMDELLFINENGEVGQGVASYAFDAATATFTFTLLSGVQYADGGIVTSDDFINALYLLSLSRYDGPYDLTGAGIVGMQAYKAGEAEEIAGIGRVDDRTFTVTIDVANEKTIAYLMIPALRVSIAGDMKRPAQVQGDKAIAAFEKERLDAARAANVADMAYGQYMLASLDVGQKATFEKHVGYFRGEPYIGTVTLQVVPVGGEMEAIMEGSIDIVHVLGSVQVVDALFDQQKGFVNLFTWPGDVVGYLGMNLQSPLFEDVNVRRALAIGFDREGARSIKIERYGEVPTSLVFEEFTGEAAPEKYAYDPETSPKEAQKLLAEAGFVPGKDGILEKDGLQFSFTLQYSDNNPVLPVLLPLLQASYAQLGIDMKAEAIPFDMLLERIEQDACDMYCIAQRLPSDPRLAADLFVGDSHINVSGYSSETIMRDLARARQDAMPERQSVLYETLFMTLYDEVPFIPLYRRSEMLLVNARVMNATATSTVHDITADVYRFFLVDTLEGQW